MLNQIQVAVVLEHQGHLCSIRYRWQWYWSIKATCAQSDTGGSGTRASRPPVLNQIQVAVVLEHQGHLCSIRYQEAGGTRASRPPVLNQIQVAVVLEHQGHLCSRPPVIQEAVVLEHQGHLPAQSIRYRRQWYWSIKATCAQSDTGGRGTRASRPPVLNQIQEAVVLEHQGHLCSIRYRRQWY